MMYKIHVAGRQCGDPGYDEYYSMWETAHEESDWMDARGIAHAVLVQVGDEYLPVRADGTPWPVEVR